MKKLLEIVVLCLFLSGNAYSKIISLNCDNSDKIFEKSEIKIDTKKKEITLFNVYTDEYVKNSTSLSGDAISKMSLTEYSLIYFDKSYAIGERFFIYKDEKRSSKLNVDIKNSKYQIFFIYGDGSKGSTSIYQCKK